MPLRAGSWAFREKESGTTCVCVFFFSWARFVLTNCVHVFGCFFFRSRCARLLLCVRFCANNATSFIILNELFLPISGVRVCCFVMFDDRVWERRIYAWYFLTRISGTNTFVTTIRMRFTAIQSCYLCADILQTTRTCEDNRYTAF